MTRLLVHVEGQTEERFVNELLARHLAAHGYSLVRARIIGDGKERGRRGGIRGWPEVRRGIVRHLLKDRGSIASTMVDYYGLPLMGRGAWPGHKAGGGGVPSDTAAAVESAVRADVASRMPAHFIPSRFVPFITVHEFEALLFSDCAKFADAIERKDLTPLLQDIRDSFATPEDINDSPHTAPSKRIEALVSGYQKPASGFAAAAEIGLEAMRAECPHFRGWIGRLEALGGGVRV